MVIAAFLFMIYFYLIFISDCVINILCSKHKSFIILNLILMVIILPVCIVDLIRGASETSLIPYLIFSCIITYTLFVDLKEYKLIGDKNDK